LIVFCTFRYALTLGVIAKAGWLIERFLFKFDVNAIEKSKQVFGQAEIVLLKEGLKKSDNFS